MGAAETRPLGLGNVLYRSSTGLCLFILIVFCVILSRLFQNSFLGPDLSVSASENKHLGQEEVTKTPFREGLGSAEFGVGFL